MDVSRKKSLRLKIGLVLFVAALASTSISIVWLSAQSHYPLGLQLPPPLDKFAHASVFGALALVLRRRAGMARRRHRDRLTRSESRLLSVNSRREPFRPGLAACPSMGKP